LEGLGAALVVVGTVVAGAAVVVSGCWAPTERASPVLSPAMSAKWMIFIF
jgi:hypothetical protein